MWIHPYIVSSLLYGSLALEALLIGVHFKERCINVGLQLQHNTIQYNTIHLELRT